jgi:hypothetical protein
MDVPYVPCARAAQLEPGPNTQHYEAPQSPHGCTPKRASTQQRTAGETVKDLSEPRQGKPSYTQHDEEESKQRRGLMQWILFSYFHTYAIL